MESRERVLVSLSHKQPDRCPVSFGSSIVDGFTLGAKENFDKYMNYEPCPVKITHIAMGTVETPMQVIDWIEPDFATITLKAPWNEKLQIFEDDSYYDSFGVRWKRASYYYDVIERPLTGVIDKGDIKNYSWPDPYAKGRVEGLREEALAAKATGKAVLLDIPGLGPFEGGCCIRGWEDFLSDLGYDKNLAEALMDKLTEIIMGLWDVALSEIGDLVDVCAQGDDLGMQDRPIISPEMYNRGIKKYHKRMYDFINSKTRAKIFHHSCGSVYDLLPYMIETGIDILEAVQTSAAKMDVVKLKSEFGKELSFWGALDTQSLLQNGTPEQIDEQVKFLVQTLNVDGGYVLAPGHNIQPTVPMQNIEAMFNAFVKYR